jgi:2-polyprenyl-3-methyl-5-hydroxy-6-metoxy-1,4-benzoquinol methylase
MNKSYYKDLEIHAAPGVHEKVFEIFNGLNLRKDSSILVLGSGSGSFDYRLLDAGYKNLSSVDYSDEYKFKEKALFYKKDLNKDFYDIGKFDFVVGIEIIEHLENHAHFLKNISNLLNSNGKVIITSPNVENTYSKLKFLFLGYLSYFNKNDLNK